MEGKTVDPRPGLSEAEAAKRLRADGFNELPAQQRRGFLRILRDVLAEPMFALLLGAAVVYLAVGDLKEAVLLAVFACSSISIALVQESRTERILESLRDLTSPRALVIRGGIERRIPGREVVRDDLVVLTEGDRVPADGVLVTAHDLMVDEALLTGESAAVRKLAAHSPATTASSAARPGGDDLPVVFSGTLVVRGRGEALVTATGSGSEIGKIGLSIARIETEPPELRRQTRRLVIRFAVFGCAVSLLAAVLYGLWRGSWLDAALSGIALSMSMLPEEFPLVLTVFMVMGARRISRAQVLTRRIAAIETLGTATVLCTDKTGTLTQNRMSIAELRCGGERWRPGEQAELPAAHQRLLESGILASAPTPFDPMEKAFAVLGSERLRVSPIRGGMVLKREYGLRPELLVMVNVWEDPGSPQLVVAAKGAPEAIAGLCHMDQADAMRMQAELDAMSRLGMRVLGVAGARFMRDAALPDSPRGFGFEFFGLSGLADPLRPGVPAAVRECASAGIRVVMITGDYPQTAAAIAAEARIEAGELMTGRELETIDDAALRHRIGRVSVFARVMPEQKLRIVEALKANGEIVAMTGDGVNDAPSLKAAHIGIAMGGRGTDVAREAAALVLLDDDFGSIVAAVRLGRRIYDNLRKSMAYILAVHVPIAGLAMLPLLLGLPLILLPLHIAFLEMVIDPVCSLVFEAEPAEPDIMRRRPRDRAALLLTPRLVIWSLLQGVVLLAVVAGLFAAVLHRGLPADEARSLAFAALVATNAGLILVNRAGGGSIIAAFRQANPVLWWVLGITSAILAAILLVPDARALFDFGPLHGDDVALALLAGATALFLLGLLKRAIGPEERRLTD